MDAVKVSETKGSVRAAILEAIRNGKVFFPYPSKDRPTIEDLDAHGTYKDGCVILGGFEIRVVCESHFNGSDCCLPIGHTGDHRSDAP